MSFLSWFTRKSPPTKAHTSEASGLLNADATVPLVPGADGQPLLKPAPAEHAANRPNERLERRELLYIVVRDAMVRAGVLSASYKFKALSLDQRGRQFLIMMDLAREYGGETARLSEIEALIAQTAKARYDITVSSVYWRINDHVAVGLPQKAGTPGPAPTIAPAATTPPSRPERPPPPHLRPRPAAVGAAAAPAGAASPLLTPAPAAAATPAPALAPDFPVHIPAPVVAAPAPATSRFDPIEADEVAAFKRALASAAAARPASTAAPLGVSVHSGPLRQPVSDTGFADTEMPTDAHGPDLGSTQYGELR